MKDADNIYSEGSVIYAKENPTLKLIIDKYKQRVYYCAVFGKTDSKRLAYYERELIPPGSVPAPVVPGNLEMTIWK